MNNPRLSIFVRILLATLLPLVVIFSIVIYTINRVLYRSTIEYARERTVFVAKQATSAIEASVDNISSIVEATASHLATIGSHSDRIDGDSAKDFVKTLLLANKQAYCGWMVFEKGFDSGGRREGVVYIREDDGGLGEAKEIPAEGLADSSRSPWYSLPMRTGKPFLYTSELFDYRTGKGMENNAVVACPVMRGAEAMGVVGVDFLYQTAFDFLKSWEESNSRRVLLLSEQGNILYSSDPALLGKSFHNVDFDDDTEKMMDEVIREKSSRVFEGQSLFSGIPSLNFLTPINLKNADRALYLLSEVPVSTVYRNADRTAAVVGSLGVLGLMLLAASVYLATRNIVKPIKRLTRSAEWIANGKLDVVMDDLGRMERPRHEVDQLAASIGKMLVELNGAHELRMTAMEAEFARDRMEQSAEAKERFFANMSHEIRTPMNAILGMSELLLREPLSGDQLKYARDIKISSESLLGIINDILDLSKLESGKFPLYSVHYDVRSLLDHVNSICGFLAKNKGLGFSMHVDDSTPRYLYGDALRLKQVLMNVIGNAVKFTDAGQVRVDVHNDGETLGFSVTDTGRGIREEDMHLLFKPFMRFEKESSVESIKGTGLGLSITSHLLDLMGGSISVESVFGKGSAFHIQIPLVPGDPLKADEGEGEGHFGGFSPEVRILVVDDNQINLDVAVGILGLFGLAPDRASSGPEAIRMVTDQDYDIVFMDHMMPGMDGVEATRQIRAMGGKHATQIIIALTANAVIGTREKLIQAGMNDFLSKPIVRNDLRKALVKWIPVGKQTHGVRAEGELAAVAPAPAPALEKWGNTEAIVAPRRDGEVLMVPEDPDDQVGVPADDDGIRPEDREKVERLRGIDGLDVDKGLDRFSGLADLYVTTLEAVEEMRDEVTPRLREMLATEDANGFAIDIHGVKGALANIGADELSARALEMETAAKAGDLSLCRDRLPGFMQDFSVLSRRMREAIASDAPPHVAAQTVVVDSPPDEPPAREQGGGEELFVGLSELRTALKRLDVQDARELLDALSGFDFGAPVNSGLEDLRGMVDRGDMTGAAAFVDELMKGVDGS